MKSVTELSSNTFGIITGGDDRGISYIPCSLVGEYDACSAEEVYTTEVLMDSNGEHYNVNNSEYYLHTSLV